MFFPLGLSNFWLGAWFPFDEGQFNLHHEKCPQKKTRQFKVTTQIDLLNLPNYDLIEL